MKAFHYVTGGIKEVFILYLPIQLMEQVQASHPV